MDDKSIVATVSEMDGGTDPWKWNILLAYRGSIAHGMHNPEPGSIDDTDILAVCVPPIENYFGLREYGSRGTKEFKRGELDVVCYEARKFVRMLSQGNPNVLVSLWLNDEHYLNVSRAGEILLAHRDDFVGKHIYKPFIGYAYGQMHRMTHLGDEEDGRYATGYMGAKRKELFYQFGWDCKNGAHLIRLLRMGIEFMRNGVPVVDRREAGDADELLSIKRGEWKLDDVMNLATALFAEAQAACESCKLRSEPYPDTVNAICRDVIATALEVSL